MLNLLQFWENIYAYISARYTEIVLLIHSAITILIIHLISIPIKLRKVECLYHILRVFYERSSDQMVVKQTIRAPTRFIVAENMHGVGLYASNITRAMMS